MSETIYEVLSVEAMVGKSDPPILSVKAVGHVSSGGWSNAVLSPHVYVTPPEDGIQGFDFMAEPPADTTTGALEEVTAELTEGWADWVVGARVHSSTNAIESKG